MTEISIVGSWPLRQAAEGEEEPATSIGLRITAIILGIIGVAATLAVFFSVPGLTRIDTILCWTATGVSGTLFILGLVIKFIKKKAEDERVQNNLENQSTEESAHQMQIAAIKRQNPDSSLAKLNETQLFTPTWYQRQQLAGYEYQHSIIDWENNVEALQTAVTCAGGHNPNIQQIDIFPLCYKHDPETNTIHVDLASHLDVIKNTRACLQTGSVTHYLNSKNFQSAFSLTQNKSFSLDIGFTFGAFILEEMPHIAFFSAENALQCELGYLNVQEIIGREAKIEFKENNSKITYS